MSMVDMFIILCASISDVIIMALLDIVDDAAHTFLVYALFFCYYCTYVRTDTKYQTVTWYV